MKDKDLLTIRHLRSNARISLTELSKKTNIAVSTLYDRLKGYRQSVIKRYTVLLDFNSLGYYTRATIVLKVKNEQKNEIAQFLSSHPTMNSLYKINNGYDFLFEGVFKQLKDMEEFMEALDNKFVIKSKQVYYIIEELKKESFMDGDII